jgi:hypothetical protein
VSQITKGYVICSKSRCHRGIPSPIAVSARVFIPIEGIEHFIVLVVVQGLVERQGIEGVLRHQLKETEAVVHHLEARLAKFSTGIDVGHGFCLPTDAPTMLGNSACATLPSKT